MRREPSALGVLLKGEVDWETQAWGSENARCVDEDGGRIVYQDWDSSTSRVVSGPIGPAGANTIRGRRFRDRDAARSFWAANARVIEEYQLPGRYAFRIKRSSGG